MPRAASAVASETELKLKTVLCGQMPSAPLLVMQSKYLPTWTTRKVLTTADT